MVISHPPLLLVSKSPRRQELLSAAGIRFSLLQLDTDEIFPDDMPVEDVPEYLARLKAEAGVPLMNEDQVLLAADSVVIMDGEIFGKPGDRDHAIEMINRLAGHKHLVITGVFLCSKKRGLGFSDYTHVWIDPMSPEEIAYYVDRDKPFDKAGSYGIQDWIGWAKVSRIEGSYANVMGLPVQKVYQELINWEK
jgi:septum formation protein